MTVQKELTKNIYVGNGQTTKFPFTFECPDNHPEYIRAYVNGKNNKLTETTNFSVDMMNKAITYPANGEPLAADEQLVIMRELPVRQLMNLVNNGPYFAEDIETAFDEGIMIAQQSSEKLGRALVAPPGSTTFDPQIPIVPGKTFRVSDDGTHLQATEDPGKVIDEAKGLLAETTIKAEETATNAETAKKSAEEIKKIYDSGGLTPITDLMGSIGTALKRWGYIFANKVFAINLPIVYKSVAEMKADSLLSAGMTACTLGYYSPNDGGAGTYIIRAKQESDVDDGGSVHELVSGLVAELVVKNGTVCPEQFGAKGDGVTDDTNAIEASVQFCRNVVLIKKYSCGELNLPQDSSVTVEGEMNLNGTININKPKITIKGNGTIKVNSQIGFLLYGINPDGCRNITFQDVKLIGNQKNTCIAITNANDTGYVVYVYVNCTIRNFAYGVHSYSTHSNNSWFTSISINGIIENCNRAVHFEWGGTGSYIKSIIQPCVDNPQSDDEPLILIGSNCILDCMIWDIDSANNKKAIKITGKNNKINCPINFKYIHIEKTSIDDAGYITPYRNNVFNISSAYANGNNTVPVIMPYDNSNDICLMAGNNIVDLSVSPSAQLTNVKKLLSSSNTSWYVDGANIPLITITFDFPDAVALREVVVSGETMPDSIKFEYKNNNEEFIELRTCKKHIDYEGGFGSNDYAFWQYSYNASTNYDSKYAYGVRITINASSAYKLTRVYIGVPNILFVSKNGDDIIANTLILKSEDSYYKFQVNSQGIISASKVNIK